MSKNEPARSWEMWALDGLGVGGVQEFDYPSPHERFTRAYKQAHQEVVRVRVTENPDGRYYGWLATGNDVPTMIFAHGVLFRMCFPYNPQAEVEAGHGVVLRLDIEGLPA